MDWEIPALRIKHLELVLDTTGVDLSDVEQLVELENERRLAAVIKCLAPNWDEEKYHGESILDAQTQLFEALAVFFPPDKATMIKGLIPAQQAVRKEFTEELTLKASGRESIRLEAS